MRRGHVAALRGRLDAAAAAYREAARIAPDRALPYVGLGGVLTRLGRADDALAAYGLALDRAPSDEGAMHGRADVLAALGRRAEAAETLDRLALILERDGRLADACDVARRALELAESRGRPPERREPGRPAPDGGPRGRRGGRCPGTRARDPGVGPGRRPEGGPHRADGDDGADAPTARRRCRRRPIPSLLTLAVEESLEAGDLEEARRRALVAAVGHREVGQFHAAMDACYQALAILPSDPDIHLLLAELYLDRGWRGPAADKLVLLGRLAQLTGDAATRATAVLPGRRPLPRRPAPGGRLRLTRGA